MNVVCHFQFCGDTIRAVWALQWRLGGKGVRQRICFFTEDEANSALSALHGYCCSKGIDPREFPRAAIVVMLDALCAGHEPISFVSGRQLRRRSVN